MVLFSITADFCHVVVPPSLQSYSQDAHASRGMSANSTQKSFMPFLMNKKITDSFFFFLPFFHGPALHFAPFSYPPPFLSFQIFISLSRPLATFFFFFFNICFFLLYCFVFLFVLFFKSLFFWWKVDSLIHNCTRGSWHFTFMYAYIFF